MEILYFSAFALALFGLSGLFTVTQQTSAVIERFGRFQRLCRPGLNWRIPVIDRAVARVSLRIQQLDVDVETKTQDNVFVMTKVSVQFQVLPDKVRQAHYQLDDPARQITSYVFDLVRAETLVSSRAPSGRSRARRSRSAWRISSGSCSPMRSLRAGGTRHAPRGCSA